MRCRAERIPVHAISPDYRHMHMYTHIEYRDCQNFAYSSHAYIYTGHLISSDQSKVRRVYVISVHEFCFCSQSPEFFRSFPLVEVFRSSLTVQYVLSSSSCCPPRECNRTTTGKKHARSPPRHSRRSPAAAPHDAMKTADVQCILCVCVREREREEGRRRKEIV